MLTPVQASRASARHKDSPPPMSRLSHSRSKSSSKTKVLEAELAAAVKKIPLPGSDDEDLPADAVEVVSERQVAPVVKVEKEKSEKSEKSKGKERADEDST